MLYISNKNSARGSASIKVFFININNETLLTSIFPCKKGEEGGEKLFSVKNKFSKLCTLKSSQTVYSSNEFSLFHQIVEDAIWVKPRGSLLTNQKKSLVIILTTFSWRFSKYTTQNFNSNKYTKKILLKPKLRKLVLLVFFYLESKK